MSKKTWLDKKISNKSFKKSFEEEYERLSIGKELLKIRKQAGLTQAQVAKKIGTTASAISRYENATYDRYELQTLKKIVEACGAKLQLNFLRAS